MFFLLHSVVDAETKGVEHFDMDCELFFQVVEVCMLRHQSSN